MPRLGSTKLEYHNLSHAQQQHRMLAKRIEVMTKLAANWTKRALAAEVKLAQYEGKIIG